MSSKRVDLSWPAYGRELGLNLQRARHARGLSQDRLAHRAGIAPNTYQRYEKGESRPGAPMNPTLVNLLRLSRELEVPLARLLPDFVPELPATG